MRLFLHLFVALIASHLILIPAHARYGAPNQLILPIIQPYECFSHYPGNSNLAMYDLNMNPDILQDYEISYQPFSNCGNNAESTVQQLIQTMAARQANPNMLLAPIVVGPNSYLDSAEAFSDLPENDLMYLGPLSAISSYSDRSVYPNYARVDYTTVDQALPIIELCLSKGWKKVNILYDVQFRDFVDKFYDLVDSNDMTIMTCQSYIGTPATGSTYSETIDLSTQIPAIKTSGSYINIVISQGSDSNQVLPQFADAGLVGPGSRYVTIGTWEWTKTRPQWKPEILALTTGVLGLMLPDSTSSNFLDFNARWNALYKMDWRLTYNSYIHKNASTPPNTSAYQVYDAIMVAGIAADQYLKRAKVCADNPADPVIQATPDCMNITSGNKWKVMYSIVINTTFNGASGFVEFKPNGDRVPIFTIVNGQNASSKDWEKIGTYSYVTNQLTYTSTPILYADGAYATPTDSERGILPGDLLDVNITAPLGVLSYVIAVLGSWVTLLLIEAAVYERRYKTKKWFRIYTALASITFGVGSIWATVFISVAQMGFQEGIISLEYNPAPTILCCLIPIATSFIAFYGLSIFYHNQKVNKVLKYTETSSVSVPSDVTSESASESNHSDMEFKETLNELTLGIKFGGLLYGLVLISGLVLVHVIERVSLQTHAHLEFDAGLLIAAFAVGVPLMLAGNIMFFYLVRWRFIGAFVMALGIVLANQLYLLCQKFYYDPSINLADNYWAPYVITIITCVTAAAICFAFLGLQFSRMQLSRLALDQLLKKIKKEMMVLQTQLEQKGEVIKQKQDEIEYSRHMMDLIHYIRPLHSKTSLIAGMAKHSKYLAIDSKSLGTPLLKGGKADSVSTPTNDRLKQIKAANETEQSSPSNVKSNKNIESSQTQNSVRPYANEVAVLSLASPGNNSNKRLLRTVADIFPSIDGPIPEYLVRNITLNHILSNPVCLEIFKDTMCADKVEENVAFFLEIQRYQNMEDARDRAVLAELIVADYIDADAPYQINISAHLRCQIEALTGKGNCDKDLFNSALTEVMKLIESNNWSRFTSTKQFYTCAHVLGITKELRHLVPQQ